MNSILQLFIALSALIILHELGHFIAARLMKVDVEEFGLGYPPRILTLFQINETKYSLNWLPLGGFVRLKGETDLQAPGGLHSASPWARLLIYSAGPIMNLAAGVLIYAVMFTQTGAPVQDKVMVVQVSPDSPAAEAGLQAGDIITSVAGTEVDSTTGLHDRIYSHLGESIDLSIQRGEENYQVTLVPRENPPQGEGAIGIYMSNPTRPINYLEAIPVGARASYFHSALLITLPAQVVRGSIEPELARPVGYKGMYDVYQEVRDRETVADSPINLSILQFFATITISLGILNLLPIPALDGGRILFTLPEIVFRRRIPVEWQNWINTISITVLIALFIYINILDFTNPISFP